MCRPKRVEQLRNNGIINSNTRLRLVGSFYEIYITMHGSMNIMLKKQKHCTTSWCQTSRHGTAARKMCIMKLSIFKFECRPADLSVHMSLWTVSVQTRVVLVSEHYRHVCCLSQSQSQSQSQCLRWRYCSDKIVYT